MPASPYFLIAQVSLVAVSAVAMKVGWSSQGPLKKTAKTSVSKPATPLVSKARAAATPATAAVVRAIAVGASAVATQPPPAKQAAVEPQAIAPQKEVLERPPEPPLSNVATDMGAYRIEANAASNMDMATQTVVFTGNVHLDSKRFNLVSDQLTVYMNSAEGTLRKLVAHGHVEVVLNAKTPQEAYQGTSNEAIFDPKDSSILLTGWPVIHGYGRDHRAATADTAMVLYTDKPRLITRGRASTRLTGKSAADAAKMGSADSKPAPTR